jgi:hypothetical protein
MLLKIKLDSVGLNVGTCIAQASNVVGFKAPIKSQSTK